MCATINIALHQPLSIQKKDLIQQLQIINPFIPFFMKMDDRNWLSTVYQAIQSLANNFILSLKTERVVRGKYSAAFALSRVDQ